MKLKFELRVLLIFCGLEFFRVLIFASFFHHPCPVKKFGVFLNQVKSNTGSREYLSHPVKYEEKGEETHVNILGKKSCNDQPDIDRTSFRLPQAYTDTGQL